MEAQGSRTYCLRCQRPHSACWCADLAPLSTRTRVVFLQHPREARVAIGTARMAHLGLAGSELYRGIDFSAHERVAPLVARPGTALLYPGEGAVEPASLESAPETLIILDGTWPQARRMMALNPALHRLPRIGLTPQRPGNYRIRREPAAHCVATVEAVVEVLGALEGDPVKFQPLLQAFDRMVDRQIAGRTARIGPPRRHLKPADPWWRLKDIPDLEAWWPRLVAVAGEANAHRRDSGVPGEPELLHLAARRLATGEEFEAFLAPARPLAPAAAHHLSVPRATLLGGVDRAAALGAWREFLRPGDHLVGWGTFAWDLLAREGWIPDADPIDLRLVAALRLKRRPGTVQAACTALGGAPTRVAHLKGRGGRTVGWLAAIIEALLREKAEWPA